MLVSIKPRHFVKQFQQQIWKTKITRVEWGEREIESNTSHRNNVEEGKLRLKLKYSPVHQSFRWSSGEIHFQQEKLIRLHACR